MKAAIAMAVLWLGCHSPAVDERPGDAAFGIDAPVVPGEVMLRDGDNAVEVAAGEVATFWIESLPSEHVAFVLTFASASGVVMSVERWDGTARAPIGFTDAGAGLRVLAVRDPSGPAKYWVLVRAGATALHANLAVTRTPFEDGNACSTDCAHLLQLPLPNDPSNDGYATDEATVMRYWFGRRDLVMFLRAAGRAQALAGHAPFIPQDLSQWDGQTPGTDVGAPRHASHQRGKDVDLSLYGTDGLAPWRSYCTTTTGPDGRECIDGSASGFDGYGTAVAVGSIFATGRVTMSFLDRELIELLVPGAEQAADDGKLDPGIAGLYADGTHVQHWPNHDNHIHIRVSEDTLRSTFEAP